MSKPSRDKLLSESHSALEHAKKVCDQWKDATLAEITAAHKRLNDAGDALALERGIDHHLTMVKNYKAALLIHRGNKERQAKRSLTTS